MCLALPSALIPAGFPANMLFVLPTFSPIRATCLAHLFLLDMITKLSI